MNNFIEEVKTAVSGYTLCKHKYTKRIKLEPVIGGGIWVSGYQKKCEKCDKIVKEVRHETLY